MTLSLLKRLAKGSPLSAVELDAILSAIENEVNAKVGTTDTRLSDSRTPLPHTHIISAVTDLQATLDAKAEAEDLDALETVVGGKVDDDDARLTDRRAPAEGDYTGFTVAAGGAATLTPAGVLAAITAADAAQAEDIIEALDTPIQAVLTASGASIGAGIIAATEATTGQGFVVDSGGALEAVTFGTGAFVDALPTGAPTECAISSGAVAWNFTGRIEVYTDVGENITTPSVVGLALYARGVIELNFSGAYTVTFPSTWKVPDDFNPSYTGAAGETVYLTIYRRSSSVYHITIGSNLTAVA